MSQMQATNCDSRSKRHDTQEMDFHTPGCIEWLLIGCVAVSLLIVPWRFTQRFRGHLEQKPAPYALLFWQRTANDGWWFAEIDTTRYLVQVFAVATICSLAYLKIMRGRSDKAQIK